MNEASADYVRIEELLTSPGRVRRDDAANHWHAHHDFSLISHLNCDTTCRPATPGYNSLFHLVPLLFVVRPVRIMKRLEAVSVKEQSDALLRPQHVCSPAPRLLPAHLADT